MSFLKSLVNTFKAKPNRNPEEAKKQFFQQLLQAVRDGELTSDEIEELESAREELGLTEADVNGMKTRAFQIAMNAATADGVITPKEERDLEKIRAYLGVSEKDFARNKATFTRMRFLYEVQRGNLPLIDVPGLHLMPREAAHFNLKAVLLEGIGPVRNKNWLDEASGVLLQTESNLMQPAHYQAEMAKGHRLPDKGLTQVVDGSLSLTNQRVVFNAISNWFSHKYENVAYARLYEDALVLGLAKGGFKVVAFSNPEDADLIGYVLAKYLI